jgi:hypothetical protein
MIVHDDLSSIEKPDRLGPGFAFQFDAYDQDLAAPVHVTGS